MSDDTCPAPAGVNRFEWERRFRSSDIPATTKLVGWTMSTYASRDGTNMHPGVQRLMADCGILSDKTVRKHLAALVELGWIERTFHGSSAGRQALADVYRLVAPIAVARPWSREEHRYFDHASPVDGSLTPVVQATAHHVSTHHEVLHHSSRLALAHDKSRADEADDEDDLAESIREYLEAWSLKHYGVHLDLSDEQHIVGMVARGVQRRVIEHTIKKRIREAAEDWRAFMPVELAEASGAPF